MLKKIPPFCLIVLLVAVGYGTYEMWKVNSMSEKCDSYLSQHARTVDIFLAEANKIEDINRMVLNMQTDLSYVESIELITPEEQFREFRAKYENNENMREAVSSLDKIPFNYKIAIILSESVIDKEKVRSDIDVIAQTNNIVTEQINTYVTRGEGGGVGNLSQQHFRMAFLRHFDSDINSSYSLLKMCAEDGSDNNIGKL